MTHPDAAKAVLRGSVPPSEENRRRLLDFLQRTYHQTFTLEWQQDEKLSEQEEKYSAELDEALKQYAELKEQAAGMDTAELMDARLAVREEKKRSAVYKVKSTYGEKYDPTLMHDSKRDVANLLHEEAEARSVREFIRRKQQQQAQQKQNKKKNRDSWER